VTVDSVTLSDAGAGATAGLAGNYSLSAGQTIAAHITPAALTLSVTDTTRLYGDANPEFSTVLSGFVGTETLATSGATGRAQAVSTATLGSQVGVYPITPTATGLSISNYVVQNVLSGSLSVTPRPLSVTADNVVWVVGDPQPGPFKFSSGQGGLVNGDLLASVSIAAPAISTGLVGGEVLTLTPSNATLAPGSLGNYQVNYKDGYLIVLPKPADLAKDNASANNDAFFLELDPQDIATVRSELENQQAQVLTAPHPDHSTPVAFSSASLARSDRDPRELERLARRVGQGAPQDSIDLLKLMRSEPLLLWNSQLTPRLLQVVERDER